jgi:hypothetical protein
MAGLKETLQKAYDSVPMQGVREVAGAIKKAGTRVATDMGDLGKSIKNEAIPDAKQAIQSTYSGVKHNFNETKKLMSPDGTHKAKFKGYSDALLKKKAKEIERNL